MFVLTIRRTPTKFVRLKFCPTINMHKEEVCRSVLEIFKTVVAIMYNDETPLFRGK